MPKIEAASMTIKISLAQIIDTGNIRDKNKYGPDEKGEYPKEIIELANSIMTVGQLQPVNVKLIADDDVKTYELIAGGRRRAAFQYLCSIGQDFTMIDAKVMTGEKLTIQLVENIQREDLTAPEREAAIYQLSENGMKQVEIAAQLSKNKGYVSINISAHKMRLAAEKEKIDLTGVETSTLAELLSVPDDELISVLRELVRLGGTRTAAGLLAEKYKKRNAPPPESPAPAAPAVNEPPPEKPSDGNEPPPMKAGPPPEKPQETKKPDEPKPPQKPDRIEADHRVIDVNIILTVIYDYIKSIQKTADSPERLTGKALTEINTAETILALIHKKLDDA